MSPTKRNATTQPTSTTTHQTSNEAFLPTKKPRTSLGTTRTLPKGPTPRDAPPASETPRRARRALTKGASPIGRTLSAAPKGEGNGGGGNGGGGNGGDGEPAVITVAHDLSYARVRAEIEALRREEVRRITVHVPAASMLVLGALPRLLALRQAMADEFTNPPLEALDKLEDYANAAALAHAWALPHDAGETRVRELLNEAMPLREHLLLNAASLASVGLLDAKNVAAIRQGTGHLDTARDLMSLGLLYLDAWPFVASKTPFEQSDAERAIELGKLLLAALGRRDEGTDGSADPREADERLGKAYELLRRAYEWCRAAVVYLRRNEGDADLIAPPLAHSRRRGRGVPADEPEPVHDGPGDLGEPDEGEPARATAV